MHARGPKVDGVEQLRGQRSTTQHDRGNQWEESKAEADAALQLSRIRGAATRSWLPDPKLQEHEERQDEAGYPNEGECGKTYGRPAYSW